MIFILPGSFLKLVLSMIYFLNFYSKSCSARAKVAQLLTHQWNFKIEIRNRFTAIPEIMRFDPASLEKTELLRGRNGQLFFLLNLMI